MDFPRIFAQNRMYAKNFAYFYVFTFTWLQNVTYKNTFWYVNFFICLYLHSLSTTGKKSEKYRNVICLSLLYTSNILYPAKTSPYNYSTYREKYENNSSLEVSPKFWPFFVFLLLNPMWIFMKNVQNFGQTIGNELFPYFSRYVGYL